MRMIRKRQCLMLEPEPTGSAFRDPPVPRGNRVKNLSCDEICEKGAVSHGCLPGWRRSGKFLKNERKTVVPANASCVPAASIALLRGANQRISADSALDRFVTHFFTRSPCR
ncbi:MAG: hypothetical protein M3Z96_09110, partial [Pseudomonadota bacterium]|nr:hypothetical protein [Pseudomonadota bacterium]